MNSPTLLIGALNLSPYVEVNPSSYLWYLSGVPIETQKDLFYLFSPPYKVYLDSFITGRISIYALANAQIFPVKGAMHNNHRIIMRGVAPLVRLQLILEESPWWVKEQKNDC